MQARSAKPSTATENGAPLRGDGRSRCAKRRQPPSYMSYWSYMSYRDVQDCQCRGTADSADWSRLGAGYRRLDCQYIFKSQRTRRPQRIWQLAPAPAARPVDVPDRRPGRAGRHKRYRSAPAGRWKGAVQSGESRRPICPIGPICPTALFSKQLISRALCGAPVSSWRRDLRPTVQQQYRRVDGSWDQRPGRYGGWFGRRRDKAGRNDGRGFARGPLRPCRRP